MEADLQDKCNGTTTGIKENGFYLYPVSQSQSGVGLPYAPEDFPNPGDKWIWKVGKRIAVSGYFYDRYLYLPTHLQKEHKVGYFASKLTVKQFVMTSFPGTNVDAFFASFIWKVPSIKIKDDTEIFTPVTGNSHNNSQVAIDCCKAGNSTCSGLSETENRPLSDATPCDFCCSEPDFCIHCCCILCCRYVHEDSGGYDYIRCDSMVGEGFVCGHGVHIECGLRSYMAGTVGGEINLDAEYYCRRCDTKTDLIPHVMNIFRRCEFIDSQDDIEKVLNICVSALRGSSKLNAQRLLHHIGSAVMKLKNGISCEDLWKMEDLSAITTAAPSHSGFTKEEIQARIKAKSQVKKAVKMEGGKPPIPKVESSSSKAVRVLDVSSEAKKRKVEDVEITKVVKQGDWQVGTAKENYEKMLKNFEEKSIGLVEFLLGEVEKQGNLVRIFDQAKHESIRANNAEKEARSYANECRVKAEEIENLNRLNAEQAERLSQIEAAHMKELDQAKEKFMNDAARTMLETRIEMILDFKGGKHHEWNLEDVQQALKDYTGEEMDADEVNSPALDVGTAQGDVEMKDGEEGKKEESIIAAAGQEEK